MELEEDFGSDLFFLVKEEKDEAAAEAPKEIKKVVASTSTKIRKKRKPRQNRYNPLSPSASSPEDEKDTKGTGTLTVKQMALLEDVMPFYQTGQHLEQLRASALEIDELSMRVLNHLVTAVVEKTPVQYIIPADGSAIRDLSDKSYTLKPNDVLFDLKSSYKQMLQHYRKYLSDFFRRHQRVWIELDNGEWLETTPGQLNMWRWAVRFRVLEYARKDLEGIKKDMKLHKNQRKTKQEAKAKVQAYLAALDQQVLEAEE
jgi:hypothetical protein